MGRSGVPTLTVALMAVVLLIGVVLNAVIPENVFLIIASLATFATVWVWIMILVSHLGMSRERARAVALERLHLGLGYDYDPEVVAALECALSAH